MTTLARTFSQVSPRLSVGHPGVRTSGSAPPARLVTSPVPSSFPGTRLQDPETQCLLLSDGRRAVRQNHVVLLPAAEGGSSTAAISFTGALKIPVSTCAWGGFPKGAFVHTRKRNRPLVTELAW